MEFKTEDISNELNSYVMKGVQHKYPETVLVITTPNCFNYCDFCFRKRFVETESDEETFDIDYLDKLTDYLNQHKEVTNVLLTGGDFLTLDNEIVKRFLTLSKIDHLEYIRIGTRALSFHPSRFDEELIELIRHKRVTIQTHFNNSGELTPLAADKVSQLRENSITLYNQTVLLKGINDNSKTIKDLLIALEELGIQSYYFYQCRPIRGNEKYVVPLKGWFDIFKSVRSELDGKTKLFKHILTNKYGKIEQIGMDSEYFYFKFNQCIKKGLIDIVFRLPLDSERFWIYDYEIEDVFNLRG